MRGDRAASFDATQAPQGRVDDERLFAGIVELAMQYGCYAYHKIVGLPRTSAGWAVNEKRIEQIRRLEGTKVPAK